MLINLENLRLLSERHKKVKSDQNFIDYSLLLKYASDLNNDYPSIMLILQNKFPLSDFLNEESVYHCFDDKFNSVTQIGLMARDAILLLLKSVVTVPPKPCSHDIQVPVQSLPNEILNPPFFNFGNMKWLPGEHRPQGITRYIHNFNIHDAREKIDKLFSNPKINKESSSYREARLFKQYIEKVLNQTRGLNIAKMCFAAILFSRIPNYDSLICKKECECVINNYNPVIYYLQQLFSDYISWPFLDTSSGMFYPYKSKLSSQLPLLTYSVLNRGISYMLDTVSVGFFNLCISCYYEWAKVSLDDLHLEQKGNMNSVRKLLNECVVNSSTLTFSHIGLEGTDYIIKAEEFWITDEKEKLHKILKETKTTRWYFDVIEKLLTKKMSRDQLIKYKMALACCTNNTVFKKSSPTMEYDRSAQHNIYTPVLAQYPELTWNSFPLKPRYIGMLSVCYNKLKEYESKIRNQLKSRDLETEFWDRLTNNSAGMTSEHIITRKKDDPLLRAAPNLPYEQRYISALLDNDILYNRELALEAICKRVKAGKREQIDRRSRWIMMVSNVMQIGFSVALSYGRELTKLSRFIASGKQVGDIRDMLKSLRATAQRQTIITDNDIKGMDSSTQEQVADMVLNVVVSSLQGLKIERFFYAREQRVNAIKYDKNGLNLGEEQVELNAVQIFLIDIFGHMRSNQYEYHEGWVDNIVYIAGSVFWSGAFHTAVQHNTLLSSVLDVLSEYIKAEFSQFQVLFNGDILGDDISLELRFNEVSNCVDQSAEKIIMQLIENLKNLGFQADPESSRYQATFLQQSALMGAVEPKHARLAITVAEQSIGRSKDPFGQVKEIGDILDELSGRSIYNEGSNVVLLSFWSLIRIMPIRLGYGQEKRFANLKLTEFSKWIKYEKGYLKLIIPFVGVFIPEIFGAPPPPMFDKKKLQMIHSSFYSPKGMYFYWVVSKCFKKIIDEKELKELFEIKKLKRNEKLEIKRNKGILSSGRAELINQLPVYLNLLDELDQKELFLSGFTLALTLFEIIPKSSHLEKNETEGVLFTNIINIAKSKQNSLLAQTSSLAKEQLLKHGIQVPEELAYYMQPVRRIKEAIKLKKEKTRKIGLYNDGIIDKLYAIITKQTKILFNHQDLELVNYDIIDIDVPVELCPEIKLLRSAALSPCIHFNSLAYQVLKLFGTPFGDPSIDASIEALKSELTVGADVETILEQANKIERKNPLLLDSFLYFIGLKHNNFARVKRVLREYAQRGILNYKSVVNKRKHFFISSHTSHTTRLGIVSKNRSFGYKWEKLQGIVIRDYFHANPFHTRKIKIIPHYSLGKRLTLL